MGETKSIQITPESLPFRVAVYYDPQEIEERIGVKAGDFDAAEKAICSVLSLEMEHIYFEGDYT